MMNKERVFLEIYELGVIKFRDFILKSGIHSPIYIDPHPILSRLDLLKN